MSDVIRLVPCSHQRKGVIVAPTTGYPPPYYWCPDCCANLGPVTPAAELMEDVSPASFGKQETVAEEIARLQSEIARLEGRLRFLVLGDPRVGVHVPHSPQERTKEPE